MHYALYSLLLSVMLTPLFTAFGINAGILKGTELDGAPQHVDSTVDLNDSHIELEKILLPSTAPNSGLDLSMDNFKFNAKQKGYHAEAACATPTKLFVKSCSFEDVLHDTKSTGRSRPEFIHNTGISRLCSNHRATSAVSSNKELHLKQKQLQKRVSLAHKDWNNNNLPILQRC